MFIRNIFKSLFLFTFITSVQSMMVTQPKLTITPDGVVPVGELIKSQLPKLKNTSIFVFMTEYNERPFIPYLAESLKQNIESLNRVGCQTQLRVLCDGNPDDQIAVKQAFERAGIPSENYKIAINEKNLGIGKTRVRNLTLAREDVMGEIRSGRYAYFTLIDGDDIVHKDYLLISLATLLHRDSDVVKMDYAEKNFPMDLAEVKFLQQQDLSSLTCCLGEVPLESFLVRDDHCSHVFAAKNIFNPNFDFDFSKTYIIKDGSELPSWFYTWLQKEGIFDDTFASLKLLTHSGIYKKYTLASIFDKTRLIPKPNPYYADAIDWRFKQVPLYYYMQHEGSDSTHSSEIRNYFKIWSFPGRISRFLSELFVERPEVLTNYFVDEDSENLSINDTYARFYKNSRHLTRLLFFVFQSKDCIDEANLWRDINSAIAIENFSNIELISDIFNILKDAHKIAVHFNEIVEGSKSASFKLQMAPILRSDLFKGLLAQDQSNPLPIGILFEKYKKFYCENVINKVYDHLPLNINVKTVDEKWNEIEKSFKDQ